MCASLIFYADNVAECSLLAEWELFRVDLVPLCAA